MSQEINLLNLALRPKQDPAAFRFVAPATGAALLLVLALFGYARVELAGAQRANAEASQRLSSLQQELKVMQEALGTRKGDPALEVEQKRLTAVVAQRSDVLRLARGMESEQGGVADVMRGFARQRVEGVWLTGFIIGPSGFDIRGRLVDPSLLPAYIRRLNGEPAFRGRQFAALDMQGVEPGAAPAGSTQAPPPAPAGGASGPARYTEFALQATLPVAKEKKE